MQVGTLNNTLLSCILSSSTSIITKFKNSSAIIMMYVYLRRVMFATAAAGGEYTQHSATTPGVMWVNGLIYATQLQLPKTVYKTQIILYLTHTNIIENTVRGNFVPTTSTINSTSTSAGVI